MKTLLGVVIAAVVLAIPILVLAFAPAPDAGGKTIEYKTYNGYAEARESGLHGADSFLALTTWAEFDHMFGPVVTPRGAPDPIAKSAFDSQLFVGVIKRDDVLWDFKVDKVTANGDTLTVSYRTTSHKVEPLPPRRETGKVIRDTMKAREATSKLEVKETVKIQAAEKDTIKVVETKKSVETKKEGTFKGETMKKEDTTGKAYATERQRSASSNFDSTLLLSVPKEKYATVIFIENGRKVGSARVGN